MIRATALALLIATPLMAASPITKEVVGSGGRTREYFLFVPQRPGQLPTPMPLVVTLHGSGHDGRILVEHWQKLADKEGIVVAGPSSTDPQHWASPIDGPDFLRDVVEDVKKKAPIDTRRIYLFGHSAGAIFGLQMSLLESEYFAATAVHAGLLYPTEYNLMSFAARKIPMWITVGTNDRFFSVDEVRKTRDQLQGRGFPVELYEMPRHTHDYYGSSREINDRAWQFLSKVKLEREPQFTQYGK